MFVSTRTLLPVTMVALFLVALLSMSFNACSISPEKLSAETMSMEINSNKVLGFTNKNSGGFSMFSHLTYVDQDMGWYIGNRIILNDYSLLIGDDVFNRAGAEVIYRPYTTEREFNDGSKETFLFPDSINAFAVSYSLSENFNTGFILHGVRFSGTPRLENNTIILDISQDIPNNSMVISANAQILSFDFSNLALKVIIENTKDFTYSVQIKSNAEPLANLTDDFAGAIEKKKERIDKFLKNNSVAFTKDIQQQTAYNWALISLDGMVVERGDSAGIVAGLPWFNMFYMRDMLVSLSGASMSQNNFELTRKILLNINSKIVTDSLNSNFARLPNIINSSTPSYENGDTPYRFIDNVNRYWMNTADTALLKVVYPNIKNILLYTIKSKTDENGFYKHLGSETWMESRDDSGVIAPRGDRAVEMQVFWFKALSAGSTIAATMDDTTSFTLFEEFKQRLARNFSDYFVNSTETRIYDYIKPDGSPDSSLRSNLFTALAENELLPSQTTRLSILANAMKHLVLPHGVLSLDKDHPFFHPYHIYPPFYFKGDAYHNGLIFPYMTGKVIDILCSFHKADTAYVMTKYLNKLILQNGAPGTLPAVLEAMPRRDTNEIKWSESYTQAWSLAEYIRSFSDSYFGVSPDAPNNALYLLPTLPKKLQDVTFTKVIGKHSVKITYLFNSQFKRILVKALNVKDSLDIGVSIVNDANVNYQAKTVLYPADELIIEVPALSKAESSLKVIRNGSQIAPNFAVYPDKPENESLYQGIKFAHIDPKTQFNTIKMPDFAVLFHKDVKNDGGSLAAPLLNVSDPADDEIYSYPTERQFEKGILDFVTLSIRADKDSYYFLARYSNLVNPLWNPEYGFQLTFSAICFSVLDDSDKGTVVGKNSKHILPISRAFNRVIYIGGGLEVADANLKVLASYTPMPEDVIHPLGSALDNEIEFTLKKSIVGNIDVTKPITILTGAQEDYARDGIGFFREVYQLPSLWNGGGKKNPNASNVYDITHFN